MKNLLRVDNGFRFRKIRNGFLDEELWDIPELIIWNNQLELQLLFAWVRIA